MRPEKKTEIIEAEWWTCYEIGHHHKKKAAADQCVENEFKTLIYRTGKSYDLTRRLYKQRKIITTKMVILGDSFDDVGKEFDLSGSNIRHGLFQVIKWSIDLLPFSEEPPPHQKLVAIRKNKEYWLDKVNAVADHWGVGLE